jgi:hypothetical protein
MLNLAATTDKLQVVTSTAAAIDVHASFADLSGTTVTPGKQNTAISTATTTDIVAAPGASTVRNVKTLHIRNKHATLSDDITLIYDQNGTDFELFKTTLRVGEQLEYVEGIGFFILESEMPFLRVQKLVGDQTNSTTTATEVTGLSVTTGVGVFDFQYKLLTTTSVGTTTPKFAVNHTGTVTDFVYWVYSVSATTTAADGVIDGDVSLVTGGLFNVQAARAKSTTALTAFVSHDATTNVLYMISGLCICTVDGDLELWHGSETAALTTVKAGSSLVLTRTGD